jgi:hypothetical protein
MITISLLYGYNNSLGDIILQSFIHLKFFIFFYILDKFLTLKDIEKIIKFLFIFTIMGFLLNILVGNNFSILLNQQIRYRSSFLRIGGFQTSPNLLGLTLGLFYIYFLYTYKKELIKILILTFLFILMIFMTGSRSSLIIIPIGLIFYYFSLSIKYKIYTTPLIIVLFSTFIILIFSTDILERTMINISSLSSDVDNSGYIRGIMFYYGIELSLDHFPIGTGVATFGTILSQNSYVYEMLDLAKKSFFINDRGIYDSNIATILGELGFMGILIMFFIKKHY